MKRRNFIKLSSLALIFPVEVLLEYNKTPNADRVESVVNSGGTIVNEIIQIERDLVFTGNGKIIRSTLVPIDDRGRVITLASGSNVNMGYSLCQSIGLNIQASNYQIHYNIFNGGYIT